MPQSQPQVIYLPAPRDTTAQGAAMVMHAIEQILEARRQRQQDKIAEEDRQRRIQQEDINRQRQSEAEIAKLATQTSMYEPAKPTVAVPTVQVPGWEDLNLPPEPQSVQLGDEQLRGPMLTEVTLTNGQKMPFRVMPSAELAEPEARFAKNEALLDTLRQFGMKTELEEGIKDKYRDDEPPAIDPMTGLAWNQETKKFDLDVGHKPTKAPAGYKEWVIDGKRAAYTDAEVAEAKAAGKDVKAYHAPQQSSASGAVDTTEAQATAEAWRDGTAFPSSQKATGAALVWMKNHPEDFPRVPRKLTPTQQDRVLAATSSLDRIAALRESYAALKGKIGPVAYRLNELGVKLPGIKEDPDFVAFNTALRQLDNLDIKRITGAQMSEGEADRLMKGMATGALKPKDFEAALRVMEMDAEREQEITLYGTRQGAKKPAAATPAAGAAGAEEEWIRDPATGKLRRK